MFDVVLNGDLTIASDLDIFERVGRGVAFDEYVEFEVKDGKILYEGDESEITAGKMRVEFIKVRFCREIFFLTSVKRGSLMIWLHLAVGRLSPFQLSQLFTPLTSKKDYKDSH